MDENGVHMKWKRGLAGCVAAWLLCTQAVALDAMKTQEFTLDNGLKVVVLPHPRAPIVTHMLWFAAGGADEPQGKSGVAHFLEHMMFKGTPKHPKDSYSHLVDGMGGQHNAFTSDDFTAYYATVAKEHLEEIMELESDRVMHIAPPKDSYASERQVVLEERRMRTDNDPSARMAEALDAKMFAPHPYSIPVIGWPQEIAKLGEADVMGFFHQHYVPKNATLLVVGDVDAAQVKALAQKYYGPWMLEKAKESVPARVWKDVAVKKEAIVETLHDNTVKQPQWQRQYMAPSLGYGDKAQVFPLIVMADMLCGGTTSELHRMLVVEQKKASSVSCGYNAFARGPSEFSVEIIPEAGVSAQEIAAIYEKSVAEVLAMPHEPKTLAQVKSRMQVESIYARDGVSGMAFILGQLLMSGYNISFFNAWSDNIGNVSWDDIVKAGKAVLQSAPYATGVILPLDSAAPTPAAKPMTHEASHAKS